MKESKRIWEKFIELDGAFVNDIAGIGSECAIGALIDVIQKRKPKSIIEFGSGIGTLTYAILDTVSKSYGFGPEFKFYTIENNEFCLEQVKLNLSEFDGQYQVIPDSKSIPSEDKLFDLMIIDGGGNLPGDMGEMDLNDMLAPNAIVLVEGGRKYQRDKIKRQYQNRSFAYIKVSPIDHILTSKQGVHVHNKACHIFMFERGSITQAYFNTISLFHRIKDKFVTTNQ